MKLVVCVFVPHVHFISSSLELGSGMSGSYGGAFSVMERRKRARYVITVLL